MISGIPGKKGMQEKMSDGAIIPAVYISTHFF